MGGGLAGPELAGAVAAAPDPDGDKTFRTTLFGLGWHASHRVVVNAATRQWCHDAGRAKLPRTDRAIMPVLRMQTPSLPMFSPDCPNDRDARVGVDRTALYAGETVLRMTSVISARQAVTDLAPR